jgi:UDP-N-acetylglucosamine 4,6-dehydratase/5-epimerase
MITTSDSATTIDIGPYYVILPINNGVKKRYVKERNATTVPDDFCYNSGTNPDFLGVEALRDLIQTELLGKSH